MTNATIRFSDLTVMEISFDETDYGTGTVIGKLYYRAEGGEVVLDIVLAEQSGDEGGGKQ